MKTNFPPEPPSTVFGTLSAKLGGMKTDTDIGKLGLPTGRTADRLFSLEFPANPLANDKLHGQNFTHQMVTQSLARLPMADQAQAPSTILEGEPARAVLNIPAARMTIGPVAEELGDEQHLSDADLEPVVDNIEADRIMHRLLAGDGQPENRTRHLSFLPASEETPRIDFRPQNSAIEPSGEPLESADENVAPRAVIEAKPANAISVDEPKADHRVKAEQHASNIPHKPANAIPADEQQADRPAKAEQQSSNIPKLTRLPATSGDNRNDIPVQRTDGIAPAPASDTKINAADNPDRNIAQTGTDRPLANDEKPIPRARLDAEMVRPEPRQSGKILPAKSTAQTTESVNRNGPRATLSADMVRQEPAPAAPTRQATSADVETISQTATAKPEIAVRQSEPIVRSTTAQQPAGNNSNNATVPLPTSDAANEMAKHTGPRPQQAPAPQIGQAVPPARVESASVDAASILKTEQPVHRSPLPNRTEMHASSEHQAKASMEMPAPTPTSSERERPSPVELRAPTDKPVFEQPANMNGKMATDIAATTPISSAPAAANAMPTSRTIAFDWNAPQFVERFASELGRLTTHGDFQKFEINPRNLGRMEVSFFVRDGQEQIQISTVGERVREVIMQHLGAVQEVLKAQGRGEVNLRVDVRDNDPSEFQNAQSGLAQQQGGDQSNGETYAARAANSGQTAPLDGDVDDPKPSDNSRYA